VVTAVISAVPGAAVVLETATARLCEGVVVGAFAIRVSVDDALSFAAELESLAVRPRVVGTGLGGGNSSWEIAMTISDRKSARKKRLSIQGTGS
jgi:ethanolamine transporter EutH